MTDTLQKKLIMFFLLLMLVAWGILIFIFLRDPGVEGDFVINENIPEGYSFTDPAEALVGKKNEDASTLTDGGVFKTPFVTLTFNESVASYTCADSKLQGDSEAIEFFRANTEEGTTGGGNSRSAYRCGSQYIIVEYQSSEGFKWAGPFTLK